jgi:hypothetical protein
MRPDLDTMVLLVVIIFHWVVVFEVLLQPLTKCEVCTTLWTLLLEHQFGATVAELVATAKGIHVAALFQTNAALHGKRFTKR